MEETIITSPENRIQDARNAILKKELTITWETDPKKMDFSKLRWFPDHVLPGTYIIEYLPVNSLNKTYPDLVGEMGTPMLDLIDFVKTGAKIIPPAFIKIPEIVLDRRVVNNKIIVTTTKTGLQTHDGCHRLSLAKSIGLSVIPVIIFDYNERYKFIINRWVAVEGYNVSEV